MKATAFHSVIHLKEEDLLAHEPVCPLCFVGFERTQGFSPQSDTDVFLLVCPRCRGFSASPLRNKEALRAYYGRYYEQLIFRDSDKVTFHEPQRFARHLLRKVMPFLQNEKLKILDFGGARGFTRVCNGDFCSQQFVQGPLAGLGSLWSFLAQLVIYFITPALIVTVYHHGFGGGFNVGAVWQLATTKVSNSVIGGLVIFVAGIIGALGLIACCIGVFFTIIYSLSIEAATVAWFERQTATPPAPAVPAA